MVRSLSKPEPSRRWAPALRSRFGSPPSGTTADRAQHPNGPGAATSVATQAHESDPKVGRPSSGPAATLATCAPWSPSSWPVCVPAAGAQARAAVPSGSGSGKHTVAPLSSAATASNWRSQPYPTLTVSRAFYVGHWQNYETFIPILVAPLTGNARISKTLSASWHLSNPPLPSSSQRIRLLSSESRTLAWKRHGSRLFRLRRRVVLERSGI